MVEGVGTAGAGVKVDGFREVGRGGFLPTGGGGGLDPANLERSLGVVFRRWLAAPPGGMGGPRPGIVGADPLGTAGGLGAEAAGGCGTDRVVSGSDK